MSDPNANLTPTRVAITTAKQAKIKDQELWEWIGISESMLRKCKAGDRILQPQQLQKLNALIMSKGGNISAQQKLNFEASAPLEAPGSPPFDLRVLKVRSERVWMVEIQPREERMLTSDWLLVL